MSWNPFRRTSKRVKKMDRCGTRCYLDTSGPRPKYPVCQKTSCKTSCKGTEAAYKRARQQRNQKVARKAKQLARKNGCAWAR